MKRSLDIIISLLVLIVALPILFILAFIIYLKLGKPVLFTQIRPGLQGITFNIYKLRTMKNAFDKLGNPLPDDKRLTLFGEILRSTSIDELPALWNVLKGEMSLVGPRPLLVEYLPLYSNEQSRRHEVRPGVTGWAQVNGRNAISWEDKFNLDVWYVDNQSFWLDIKILFLTAKKVFIREGISAEGQVTMDKFTGNTKH